ncbi:hypothetical protein Tco_0209893 [Tanacetum coccineum]
MALYSRSDLALDDALVAPADRLKIGKCNLRLSSDVTSKEATLQVVYDVLKLTPFYKDFQVTADAPEIYMQEFWASAYVLDTLELIRKSLPDVNVNKLHQPWRSFAAVINKCLSGTPSYDSLRLSQAQILWDLTEAEQLINSHKKKPSEIIALMLVCSGADEGELVLPPGFPDAPVMTPEDEYSLGNPTMMDDAEKFKMMMKTTFDKTVQEKMMMKNRTEIR